MVTGEVWAYDEDDEAYASDEYVPPDMRWDDEEEVLDEEAAERAAIKELAEILKPGWGWKHDDPRWGE